MPEFKCTIKNTIANPVRVGIFGIQALLRKEAREAALYPLDLVPTLP